MGFADLPEACRFFSDPCGPGPGDLCACGAGLEVLFFEPMAPRADEVRSGRLPGPELLAASLGSRPIVSSEDYGWREISVCSWRVDVDRFDLNDVPDVLVSLHTEGPVYRRSGRGWGPDRSVPGQVTVMPPGSSATFRRGGILGVTTVDLAQERLEGLLGTRDTRAWLSSFRLRLRQIAMRRQARSGPESAAEVITTQTGLTGEFAQRQLGAEIVFDPIADPSQRSARESARRRREFFGVIIKPEQVQRERVGQRIGVERSAFARRAKFLGEGRYRRRYQRVE
jgi:hypothetical protein